MKTRIFVVDDHQLIRRGLVEFINGESDLEVVGEASDAEHALKGIVATRAELAVVDFSLPGSSGIDLIRRIREQAPAVRVLVLSMHDEATHASRSIEAGALAYVMKADMLAKVLEAIRRIRDGQIYVSNKVASVMLNAVVKGYARDSVSGTAALSGRERDIVQLIGCGRSTREIATSLKVSVKTVETHREHIKRKLSLENGMQLVQFCVRWVEEQERGRGRAQAGAPGLPKRQLLFDFPP